MRPLFRLTGAIKHHRAVGRWLDSHPGPLGAIARRWLDVMRRCGDEVSEVLHDGQPTACVDDAAFAYVAVFTSHVNVGFFQGAELPDPDGLLEGSGKFMRHVKLRPAAAVHDAALSALIRAAYADVKVRLAAENVIRDAHI
ncbi:DUF1801 domain-containing protein [Sinimarinibacterium sp. CAU 1509]|uniref:DUF1801 domain-containing protein n=1 Tax=Sinimarinibacterium sp. CAU 1509 TaxID=2562283 RepID=UPI0010AC13ED|nr:DUF1801 domain-containing protein [Sinimarinibacterium sp. CAU 1509]TJY59980.1 DUF1801 domain-containing protein [Sinimarinibacterium sp. CAU 1509]